MNEIGLWLGIEDDADNHHHVGDVYQTVAVGVGIGCIEWGHLISQDMVDDAHHVGHIHHFVFVGV